MIRISQRPFRGAFFAPASRKRPCSKAPDPKASLPEGWDAGAWSLRIHAGRGARSGPWAGTLRGPAAPAAVPEARVRPGCPVYGAAPFLPGPASRPPSQNGGHPFLRHAGALPAYLSRFTQIADKSIPVVCSAYPWCPVAFPGGGFTRGRGSAQRFSRR